MQDVEPTVLCETCRKMLECFKKGIYGRETCSDYESLPLEELLERDRFMQAVTVGPCPKCGGRHTYSCESNPLVEDICVGHCLDCETYWCLECGYEFQTVEKGVSCPHWAICDQCSKEHGYLDLGTFIEKICPTGELSDNGCQIEDSEDCERQWQYRCPYDRDVSVCPTIKAFLGEQI